MVCMPNFVDLSDKNNSDTMFTRPSKWPTKEQRYFDRVSKRQRMNFHHRRGRRFNQYFSGN